MKILLVDDARDLRLVMKRTLSLLGYQPTVAEDGALAWQCLQQDSYEVVITDWDMPNMDGLELCRRIRSAGFANYVYIILLTGRSGKPDLIAGMAAGADDFTSKPVAFEEMAVLLRAAERVTSLERRLETQNKSLTLANQALQNKHNETLRDLRHAAALQTGILPPQKQNGVLDFAWFFRPAHWVGGDTFNYFTLSDHHQMFYAVDVSGHGISAALLSMYLSNLLTATSDHMVSNWQNADTAMIRNHLSTLIKFFNQHLLELSDHYFTMILGVIDTAEQRLHFVQAGHPKPFMINRITGKVNELDCTGFPVGLLADVDYEVTSYPFLPGSRLVLFSDGLFEILNAKGQLVSSDDLYTVLHNAVQQDAQGVVAAVCNALMMHTELDQPDDVSVLVVDHLF